VSVTGTIFSVNHGTKGSRVSVVQGEVHVSHGSDETVLHPGEQVTTQNQLDAVPLATELAWSRDVDHYLDLLREYSDLRREIDNVVPRPGLRTSRRLLDLMPEGTALYAAVPNLGERVTETHRLIRERIAASPVLREWYESGAHALEPKIDDVMSTLAEFGSQLGAEVAVGALLDSQGELHGPLVLADVLDAAGLRDFVDRLDPELRAHLVFVDDPSIVVATSGTDEVFLWLTDDLAVASPEPALIRRVGELVAGEPNGFLDTDFYAQIAMLYDEGVDILVAGDIETLVGQQVAQASPESANVLKATGASEMRHLLIEQKTLDQTYHRAVLTFKGEPTGIASWLASPAPMGALEFISPEAKGVAAFVIKDPVKMLDDLTNLVPEGGLTNAIADFETEHGLSLRDDFAAVLGGEFAFAFDGPMLPTPAWKIVVEVYDPARFQWTIEQTLAEANTALAQEGKGPVELGQEERGGRTYYSLEIEGFEIHYTYVEGYLVIAPDRAHLDRSIRFHESGYTFLQSPRFTDLLPVDRHNNFSALLFQDMAEVMAGMAEKIGQGQLSEEQRKALQEIQANAEPTLGYAYAEDDRIVLAATMKSDLLTSLMLRALGLQDPAGIEQILGAMGGS